MLPPPHITVEMVMSSTRFLPNIVSCAKAKTFSMHELFGSNLIQHYWIFPISKANVNEWNGILIKTNDCGVHSPLSFSQILNTYLFFLERKGKECFSPRLVKLKEWWSWKYFQQFNWVVLRDFLGEENKHSQGHSSRALHSSNQHEEPLWGRINSPLCLL